MTSAAEYDKRKAAHDELAQRMREHAGMTDTEVREELAKVTREGDAGLDR